jgi:hypothetical protein
VTYEGVKRGERDRVPGARRGPTVSCGSTLGSACPSPGGTPDTRPQRSMGQPAKVAAFSDRHGYDREHRLTATISSDFRVSTPSGSAGMSWRSRTRAIPAASGPRCTHSPSISTASECHPDHLGAGEHRVHAMVARVSLLTEALGGLAAPKPRRTTRARPLVLTKRADTLPGISPTSRLNPPPTPQEPERSWIFDQSMAAWGLIDRSVYMVSLAR